jgi:hypothetical protein
MMIQNDTNMFINETNMIGMDVMNLTDLIGGGDRDGTNETATNQTQLPWGTQVKMEFDQVREFTKLSVIDCFISLEPGLDQPNSRQC